MISIGTSLTSLVNYDAEILCKELERSFEKLSSNKSGRTQDGYMHIFLIGTYYNYTMTIKKRISCPDEEWDELWNVLSSKTPYHYIKVPYNQGSITFKAYITSGKQKIARFDKKSQVAKWGEINITFTACDPCGSTGASDSKGNYTYKDGDFT